MYRLGEAGGGGYVPEGKIKDLAVEKERERVADWK